MTDPNPPGEPRPLLGVEPEFSTSAAVATSLRVAVSNTASAPRVLSLALVGIDAGWVDGPQRTGVLAPGETATVEFRVTPPLGTLPARYPLALAAQALDPDSGRPTSTVTGSAESVLVVDPRGQLAVDLEPRELRLVAARKFAVLLTNHGPSTAKVDLLLQHQASVSMQLDRTVSVAPGATVRVRGRARAKRPQMIGGRISHPFTVTARGTESVKHVDGQVLQRAALGPGLMKLLALVLVLAVWAGAAVVFIPALAEKVKTRSEESAAATGPGGQEETKAEDETDAEDAAEDEKKKSEEEKAAAAAAAEKKKLQLGGTVAGEAPDNVTVSLEPTSLVDEEAQGGVGVGVRTSALDGSGLRPVSAFVRAAPDRAVPERSVRTTDDGSWAFPSVKSPGYYLVTFTKPGFQTQKFVVDSSSALAAEPLDVDLAPGEGSLSGRITGPGGRAVGGAGITITDGTNTITTSSNSEGDVGAWSIDGLSSPSTYVVSATKHGMSSEARVVELTAGGSGTASLQLVSGVATLTGKVTGPDLEGQEAGLGGLSVTVTDSAGDVRTATTLTQRPRGNFSIPGLPAPGSYSLTVSGDGFQSQTHRLKLKDGQSSISRSVSLNPSSGTLGGRIYVGNRSSGLENAAMTLSNAEHTYKTTSTRTPDLGTYAFSGVTPGTYILTTQYFGLVTDHVSVEIEAGVRSKSFDRVLRAQAGSGLPATSSLTGSVIDAQTGQHLTACAPVAGETDVFEPCLSAEITDRGVVRGSTVTDPATWDTTFAPNEQYQLPDPEDDPGQGLRPGLHTLTVKAPGYETRTVEVEVGQAGEVDAPLVEMFPAPRVTGTITGANPVDPTMPTPPSTDSCVWVLQGTASAAQIAALEDCEQAIDDDLCPPGSAPYDGTDGETGGRTAWCASTEDGDYSVQVPTQGKYTLWIQPLDDEWAPPGARPLELGQGEIEEQDAVLNRYGMVRLTVLAPNASDVLTRASGVTVTTSRALAVNPIEATNALGVTVVRGLSHLDDYSFRGTVEVLVDPTDPSAGLASVTGEVNVLVPYNDIREATLRLTDRVPYYLGRVRGQFDSGRVAVPGASVTIRAARSFGADDQPVYGDPFTLIADRLGCFSVESIDPADRTGTDCDQPVVPPGSPAGTLPLTGTDWPTGSSERHSISASHANQVSITAPGYEPMPLTRQPFRTEGLTNFTLMPAAIPFTRSAGIDPRPRTSTAVPGWGDGKIEVLQKPTQAGDITVTLAAGTDPLVGALTWRDSKVTVAGGGSNLNLIRPGTYRMRISDIPGWEDDEGTLLCPTGATACLWTDPLELQQEGAVRLTVLGVGDVPVRDALVTKQSEPQGTEGTPADGRVTFGGLTPGRGETTEMHVFRVRAAGYAFGVTSPDPGDDDAVVISCTDPAAPTADTGAEIVINPGTTTDCTIRLQRRLGTLTGTLLGVLGNEPDTLPTTGAGLTVERLGGYEVWLTPCAETDPTCDAPNAAKRLKVTTPLSNGGPPASDPGGRFTFAGTATEEGLLPGRYLLSVPQVPAGFKLPSIGSNGKRIVTVVQDADPGNDTITVDALVYAERVGFEVRLADQHNKPVIDATVRIGPTLESARDGDDDSIAFGSHANGRYTFTGVMPGRWYVFASAEGLRDTTTTSHIIGSSASGGGQVVEFTVARAGASVSGVASTSVGSTAQALSGVTVRLTCDASPGKTKPAAVNCPTTGPAMSTDQTPLEAVTSPLGTSGVPGFRFESVAAGDYVATFTRRGYQPTTREVHVLDGSPVDDADATLSAVARDVVVRVQPSHSAPDLDGMEVVLRPQQGTLAAEMTPTSLLPDAGDYVASFTAVPWGCWVVDVRLPEGHHGTLGTVQGSPGEGDLDCPDGTTLVVPDDDTTDLEVSVSLDEGLLEFSMPVTTDWAPHAPATPTVRVTGNGVDESFLATEGEIWLAPGSYDVELVLDEDDRPFWTYPPKATHVVEPDGATTVPLGVEEEDFEVTVTIPSLPAGEHALVLITPGEDQLASFPRPDPQTPEIEVVGGSTGGGTLEIRLPRGKWQIEGSWPTGPGGVVIDVQGPRSGPEQLGDGAPAVVTP